MPDQPRYWKSLEERDGAPESADEFASPAEAQFSRRGFLKASGFTLAITTAACARAPVQKALPLLVGSEEEVPGRSLWYATTCHGCSAACGALVKVRDGRPIKLEGNPDHPVSRGGLCAVGQASLLGLYDSHRLASPLVNGEKRAWHEVDAEIARELAAVRANGGTIRFLSTTITSPSLQREIDAFLSPFANARHVIYDPLSRSAILDAHAQTHGARVLPRYRFHRADVIASFDADFLGTWLSPVEFTRGWHENRDLSTNRFSYHVQFEPGMSITGAKADRRMAVAPADIGALLTSLASRIAPESGFPLELTTTNADGAIDDVAVRLVEARGRGLVVCGTNDVRHQLLVNFINEKLGNYGTTIDVERPSHQSTGDDAAVETLLSELHDGKVAALFVYDANPAFDFAGTGIDAHLKRVPLVVSFADRLDETAAVAHFVCPDRHFLESWSDSAAVAGTVSLTQPAIHPIANTRPAIESLATWSGRPRAAHDAIREHWEREIYPVGVPALPFDEFWDQSLHNGFAEINADPVAVEPFNASAVQPLKSERVPSGALALVLYPKVAMLDGRNAYNAWLHELPDPVTKVTWDNYAAIAPATAERLKLAQDDVVRVEANGRVLELPVLVQPGQAPDTVAIALGYGSRLSARFAKVGPQWIDATPTTGENGLVGVNAAVFRGASAVRLTATGRTHALAATQMHHTLTVPPKLAPKGAERRPIIQETTLAAWKKDPHSGVEDHEEKAKLWPEDHPFPGPRWGIAVDLNACTGCAGCVIACQAENNIPVVGRDEVRRNREMHWMRIDRYYSETESGETEVAQQPVMCQQCGNAPCETVCPVLATIHTEDGLNAQVYNRCVGTRYCANNCPYKGRRFNWFDYRRDDTLQNLALNPDVAVRSRGVMEKCSFCVQRIEEAKIEAKRTGTAIADGTIQPACQQSCPANAIAFGDLNDPKSRVSKLMADPRRYRLLEELNVQPAVGYLSLVRNREEKKDA